MDYKKATSDEEKLTAYLNAMLLKASTHEGLKEIAKLKRRDIQEIVRFGLEAMIIRFRSGIVKDDELY